MRSEITEKRTIAQFRLVAIVIWIIVGLAQDNLYGYATAFASVLFLAAQLLEL